MASFDFTEKEISKAKRLWLKALAYVQQQIKQNGPVPLFPIDDLQDFRDFFFVKDEESGEEKSKELDEPDFIRTFLLALQGRMRTFRELKQRFGDIDVDCGGTVSWEEFTSFTIHQTASTNIEDNRSKEFLYNPVIGPPSQQEHKDLAHCCLVHERVPFFMTSGDDGLVKFWEKEELLCAHTLSTIPEGRVVGTAINVSPIVDICCNQRGTILFTAGVDKRILAFDLITMKVSRGFMGVISPATLTGGSKNSGTQSSSTGINDFTGGGLDEGQNNTSAPDALISGANSKMKLPEYAKGQVPADMTAMLCMDHSISAFHAGYPNEREIFYVGLQNGNVQGYVSMRHAMLAEVSPLFSVKHHSKTVSKVRYYHGVGVISASWDQTLRVMDSNTGALIASLGAKKDGHQRAVLDFDFNTHSRLLASVGCDRNVFLWNPYYDSPLAVLKGHTAMLCRVSFNEIDQLLISMDQENIIKTWDMKMYQEFQTIMPTETVHHSAGSVMSKFSTMIFDSNSSMIITCGMRPYTWSARRSLSSFPKTHLGHTENAFAMRYIQSTETLITCDLNSIMSWDVKTGRRAVVFNPNPELNLRLGAAVSGVGVDRNQRRLMVSLKDGSTRVFNHRNTQLLKEFIPGETATISAGTGGEPLTVVHLTNADENSRIFAVVYPKRIIFINDAEEAQDPKNFLVVDVDKVHGGGGDVANSSVGTNGSTKSETTITTAQAFPALGKTTTGSLVVGTNDGQIINYSSTTGFPMTISQNPQRPATRHHTTSRQGSRHGSRLGSRGGLIGSRGGARPSYGRLNNVVSTTSMDLSESFSLEKGSKKPGEINQPVEDLLFLPRVDLFAAVSGDGVINFWDLRRNELKLSYQTNMTPSECLLCIATDSPQNTLLVAGCDLGFIYVRDISKVPSARSAGWIHNPNPTIPLLTTFRAHNSSIMQVVCIPSSGTTGDRPDDLVATLGADSFVKLFRTKDGVPIGYFGQRPVWKLRDLSTFRQCDAMDTVVEEQNPQPRPIRPLTRQTTTPGGGSMMIRDWGQGRLQSRGASRTDIGEDSAFLTQGLQPVTLTSITSPTATTTATAAAAPALLQQPNGDNTNSLSISAGDPLGATKPPGEELPSKAGATGSAEELSQQLSITSPLQEHSHSSALRKSSIKRAPPQQPQQQINKRKSLVDEFTPDKVSTSGLPHAQQSPVPVKLIERRSETLTSHPTKRVEIASPSREVSDKQQSSTGGKKAPSPKRESSSSRRATAKEALPTAARFKKPTHPNDDVDPVNTVVIQSIRKAPAASPNVLSGDSVIRPSYSTGPAPLKMRPRLDKPKIRVAGAKLHFTEIKDKFTVTPEQSLNRINELPPRAKSTEPLPQLLRELERESRAIKQQSLRDLSKHQQRKSQASSPTKELNNTVSSMAPASPLGATAKSTTRFDLNMSMVSATSLSASADFSGVQSRAVIEAMEDRIERRRKELKLPPAQETELCELHKSTLWQSQFGTSWISKKQAFQNEQEDNNNKARMNNHQLNALQKKQSLDPKAWASRAASLLVTTRMDPVSSITDSTLKKFRSM